MTKETCHLPLPHYMISPFLIIYTYSFSFLLEGMGGGGLSMCTAMTDWFKWWADEIWEVKFGWICNMLGYLYTIYSHSTIQFTPCNDWDQWVSCSSNTQQVTNLMVDSNSGGRFQWQENQILLFRGCQARREWMRITGTKWPTLHAVSAFGHMPISDLTHGEWILRTNQTEPCSKAHHEIAKILFWGWISLSVL